MSLSNSIRLTLNIKDPNIHFSDDCVSEEWFHHSLALVYSASLSADSPSFCPICGSLNEANFIIKHGFKVVHIKLPRVSNRMTFA